MGGKQWQTTPKKLAQDVAYQSHTGRLTGVWFLSKLAQGLNANNNNNNNKNPVMVPSINRTVNGSACYCRSRIPLRRFKIPAEYQQPTLRRFTLCFDY